MTNQQSSDNEVKETARESRQGPLGKPVLVVLVVALVLVLVAWGGAELFGELTDNSATLSGQDASSSGQNNRVTPPAGDQPATSAPAE